MVASSNFLTGVIEGFYGRPWSLETRIAYADYIADSGLNTYLYCPKSDPYLRRQWTEHWPEAHWKSLLQLGRAYRQRGIDWGVGLSPVELYREYGALQRDQLKRKVERLGELDASLLGILFDDMPGDMDSLATRQAEIVSDVVAWAPQMRILVCPTYYSFDPVLEQYFGRMPRNYWPQLGRELPAAVDIFWTGNSVCSARIDVGDIEAITKHLGRPVTLWDNYPVNDGAVRSNFLYISKLSGRSADMEPLLNGHLCNPMNQGILSLPALSGLAELYGNDGLDEARLSQVLGAETWACLSRDKQAFEELGLSGLGEDRCRELATEYAAIGGCAALEISQWLRGEYRFDPACLTD
jgi:hyaluronoglucosaminidase